MSREIDPQPAVAELYFEIAGDQIMGAQDLREIAFTADYLGDKGSDEKNAALIVMADGMAGSSARQIVASLVTSTFNNTFIRGYARTTPSKQLLASLDKANSTLSETVRATPELAGMACTLLSAALFGEKLHWASVGDNRLYLIREGQLHKLNDDHSYGGYLERLRADGVDVEADAEIAPDMLMSAVNGDAISEIDCREQAFILRANDRLMIASPGLNTLDNNSIVRTSASCVNAKECVAALLRGVKEIGAASHANATIIVVDVLERDKDNADTTATTDGNTQGSAATAATASTTAQAAASSRRSMLLDTLTSVATVLLFLGAAFASWQGLGYLNEFRRPTGPSPDAPRTLSSLPSSAPMPQSAATPGLSFGAPPPPGGSASGSAGGGGSSLSFGAPAPLSSPAAATTPNDPLPSAPMRTAAGEVFRDPLADGGEGPLMVPIPAGKFRMGNNARAQERPVHSVTIEAFAISRFEVTVEQYERFVRDSKRKMPNIDALDEKLAPISAVTWDDAHAYTRWLSAQTGERYRLPSEAQWEHAASGGVANTYWWGQTSADGRAHCQDCKTGLDPRRATRVGRFDANPFTLFDTAGNVAEWVHDCWHPNYRDAPTDGSVWEGGDCTVRVVRGGSFSSPASAIRTQARAQQRAAEGVGSVGFRVARDL